MWVDGGSVRNAEREGNASKAGRGDRLLGSVLDLNGLPLFEGPEATFSATPTEGNVPLTVLFVDQSITLDRYHRMAVGLRRWTENRAESQPRLYRTRKIPRYTPVTTRLGNDTETRNDFITVRELPRANFTASPRTGEGPLSYLQQPVHHGAAPITSTPGISETVPQAKR